MTRRLLCWRTWLHGLGAAFIGGGANAVTLIVIDPLKFNIQDGWRNLVSAVGVSCLVSAALYLKQAPLPPAEPSEDPPEPPRRTGAPWLNLFLVLASVALLSGCSTVGESAVSYSRTKTADGREVVKTTVDLGKEFQVDWIQLTADLNKGELKLVAQKLRTRSAAAIAADGNRRKLTFEGAGTATGKLVEAGISAAAKSSGLGAAGGAASAAGKLLEKKAAE